MEEPKYQIGDLKLYGEDFTDRVEMPITGAMRDLLGLLGTYLFTQDGPRFVVSSTGEDVCNILTNNNPAQTQVLVDAINECYARYLEMEAAPRNKPVP